MSKNTVIYLKNGFYSSELLPLDLNNNPKRYAYFKDIAKDLNCILDVEGLKE